MKLFRNFLLLGMLILLPKSIEAQNFYTQLHMFNQDNFNPGHVGFNNQSSLSTSFRQLNREFENNYNLSVNYQQQFTKSGIGLGINYQFNKRNRSYRNTFGIPLSFRIKKLQKINIRIGVQPTFNTRSIVTIIPTVVNPSNPEYIYQTLNSTKPDFDVGILLEKYGWQIGFSVNNITRATYKFIDRTTSKNLRRYNFHGQFEIALSEHLTTTPSFLWLLESNYNSFIISQHLCYKEKFIGGVSFNKVRGMYHWKSYLGLNIFEKLSLHFHFGIHYDEWANDYEMMIKYRLK